MNSGNKNIFLLLIAAIVPVAMASYPASMAMAVSTTINATATILLAITLTATDMDFSKIDYTGNPNGLGWWVKMGTNGAQTFNGGFSSSGGAAPAAGQVTINTGTVGHTVEIRCAISGVMANAAGKTINITNIEVKDAASPAAFGSGSACHGLGGAAATTLVLDGTDAFKFGGEIDGNTVSNGGVGFGGDYNTNNAGGTNIQANVIYQ